MDRSVHEQYNFNTPCCKVSTAQDSSHLLTQGSFILPFLIRSGHFETSLA